MDEEPIEIQLADEATPVPEVDRLHDWAGRALASLGHAGSGLTVRVVATAESRALNRAFRGRDYATNVLSFPFAPDAGELQAPYWGDLAICAAVVEREAREQSKTLDAHWAHMIVHGVAHLAGYDHQHDVQAQRMEDVERSVMGELGFADPYDDPVDPAKVDDGQPNE
jgi:probable rRNA maturation factor